MADHPDQCHLEAPAGSVAVFNGSVWHSSYHNRSGRRRRTLHCKVTRSARTTSEYQQQTNQRQYLRPETAVRLSPLARYILDVAYVNFRYLSSCSSSNMSLTRCASLFLHTSKASAVSTTTRSSTPISATTLSLRP